MGSLEWSFRPTLSTIAPVKITFLVGRLTREPVRATSTSYPRAYATIAANVVGLNGEHATEFVDVILDGHLATTMLTHGHKGSTIAGVGREHLKQFTKKSGEQQLVNEVYMLDFDFVAGLK
ncbi:MAG: single-stranded DNA-binding protein [Vulcanimicrobiaceae bacterium]